MKPISFTFKWLDRGYGAQLATINRACPIEADFTVVFERGEDFFRWPDTIYDDYHYLGAFHHNRLVGYLMVGFFKGWVGGQLSTCFYLGDARVLPDFRGHQLTQQMIAAMESMLTTDFRLGFALIKKGNSPAEAVAASATSPQYAGMTVGDLYVMNIPVLKARIRPISLQVRQARTTDINELAALFVKCNQGKLFAPPFTAAEFTQTQQQSHLTLDDFWVAERDGRLVGMFAAWDMHPFHFTRIVRYSFTGQLLRAGFKAATWICRGSAALPQPGGILRTRTITHLAIENQEPAILQAMLSHVITESLGRGLHLLSIGFVDQDPLKQAVSSFPFVQQFVSTLYCIAKQQTELCIDQEKLYVNLAMV